MDAELSDSKQGTKGELLLISNLGMYLVPGMSLTLFGWWLEGMGWSNSSHQNGGTNTSQDDHDTQRRYKRFTLILLAYGVPWDHPTVWVDEDEEEQRAKKKRSPRSRVLLYAIGSCLCAKGCTVVLSDQKYRTDQNERTEPRPLLHHQKVRLEYAPEHYDISDLRKMICSNFLILLNKYSDFRPEQVLDREDTDEEHRLLAAVEVGIKPVAVAMQMDYPEWPSEFARSHTVFEKLIENIIRWKSTQKGAASTDSCKKELVKFFSSEIMSNAIFVFLRLVSATWMCAHKDEYEPHIPSIGVGYPMELWCGVYVLPPREYTDHIPMRALAAALGVPLRVENLHDGPTHDIYTSDGGDDVPRVTLLYTGIHYDILYPRQQAEQGER
uniref:Ubiquitinyl hydrolase 1 n=1 Tax=Oryza brachyantha TaxID=4533 RepID=J3LDB3_ORYBR